MKVIDITDAVGPLGQATHIENFGTVVCAGGGVGICIPDSYRQVLVRCRQSQIASIGRPHRELIILKGNA